MTSESVESPDSSANTNSDEDSVAESVLDLSEQATSNADSVDISETKQVGTPTETSEVPVKDSVVSEYTGSANQAVISDIVQKTTSSTSESTTQTEDVTLSTAPVKIKVNKLPNEQVASIPQGSNASISTKSTLSKSQTDSTEKSNKTLPETGYYSYAEQTEVKNHPNTSEPVAFYRKTGERVFYDKVLANDGYQWISYISYSGVRRYIPLTSLTSQEKAEVTGKLAVTNQTTSGFDVVISNVKDTNGVTSVKVPVWTEKDEQIVNLQKIIYSKDTKLLELSEKNFGGNLEIVDKKIYFYYNVIDYRYSG